jgi:hypothetical protein
MEIPNLPDSYFYYGLSLVLAISVISILKWVGGRLVKTLDLLGKDVLDLKIHKAIHAQKIDQNGNDIELLKEKVFPVKYVNK